MSNYLKPLVVLIISILIFAGVALVVDKDLLDFIQTRFHNPSIIKTYITENTKDAEIAQNYISELQQKFAQSLNEPAVRNSFLYNQSAEDIFERSRIYGLLIETTSGLQAIQFVDSNGVRIHFSTSYRDIISRSNSSTSYRNYTEDSAALPYDVVSVSANGSPKFSMDEHGDRIIFSYPFYDSLDIYHGTALFSINIRALAEKLISEGRLKVNENVSVIENPAGILVGSPDSFKAEIQKKVSEVWNNGIKDRIIIDSEVTGTKFSLISLKGQQGIFFGRLVNDDLFSISESMKVVLYCSMFLTFYLALFFALNFKASPVTIVRNRIRNLRQILFEQLHEDKSTEEKIRWLLELEQRRDEVREELKYKLRLTGKLEKSINKLIDNAWDEIIAIIRASSGHAALALKIAALDSKELIQKAQESKDSAAGKASASEEVESIEEAEELAEELADDVEEVEAVEEVEEVEAVESIEDAEVIDEVEEVDEVEEIGQISVKDGFAEEDEFVQDVEELTLSVQEVPRTQSKGLLKLASEKEPSRTKSKGLLQLASEFEIYEEIDASEVTIAEVPARGLLRLASEITSEDEQTRTEVYDVTEIVSETGTRGLLARALNEIRLSNTSMDFDDTKTVSGKKGLLALASEIEFSSSYPVTHAIDDVESDSGDVGEEINEIINMDIVSPFVTMFSNLDDVKIEE